MGLIKAALGAAGGVLADQWKEFFYCESLPAEVLVSKGQKRVSGRSSNTKGSENIISNGSVIAINEGQCMIIVEQGAVVDMCAEPGEYVYDMSTEPSLFTGDLGESIKAVFSTVGKRFTFGGEAPKDQRIYFFNTKEIVGNKYGTPNPVPFRVVDERAALDVDIGISCFGEYSFKIANPMLFYGICGNVEQDYVFRGSDLESQMRSEFLTKLQPAFARLSAKGLRYSYLPGATEELSSAMQTELSVIWGENRGIEVRRVGVSSVKASEEDEQMIKDMQRNAAFMDPTRAAAFQVGSYADAAKIAAGNTAGAMTGFMGVGMAQNMGGANNAASLYALGQQQAQQSVPNPEAVRNQNSPAAAMGWTCECGQGGNTGKFCQNCGKPRPEPKPAAGSWKCACGAEVTGNFCPECGAKKPADDGWTCACGAVNKGKFCPECGAKKPAGVPQYKCDKCGWEPEKGAKAPKFCPQCGDPFDNGDVI